MSNIELLIGQSSTEGERKKQARLALQAQKDGGQMSGHLSAICPPEIELEIELEKEIEIEKEQEQTARPYGRYQNVLLTDEEMSALQLELSTTCSYYVEKLSEFMASTGRQYQSHAATIRRWAAEDMRRQNPAIARRDYSVKEGDTV